MTEEKKSYYAIIPANVRYDESLPPNAKLLYGEITALCNAEGYCWASNKYFAELYEVSQFTISRWINALANKGYITSQIIYKEGTKQIDKRYIQIRQYPIDEISNTLPTESAIPPIDEIGKDNNTSSFNTTSNNTNEYKDKSTRTRFTPPTLEEAQGYCKERNNHIDAQRFIDYYTSNGWKVGKNPMKDWKATVRNWERTNRTDKPNEQGTGNIFVDMLNERRGGA